MVMQDPTYARIFSVLNKAINPTITGLALRLAFHDAGTWNAKTRPVGGCAPRCLLADGSAVLCQSGHCYPPTLCWCINALSSARSPLASSVSAIPKTPAWHASWLAMSVYPNGCTKMTAITMPSKHSRTSHGGATKGKPHSRRARPAWEQALIRMPPGCSALRGQDPPD